MSMPAEQGPPPAPNDLMIPEATADLLDRRELLGNGTYITVGALLTAACGFRLDNYERSRLWPDTPFTLHTQPIPKAETPKQSGTEFMITGGLAQQSSRPAAVELAEELGRLGFSDQERVTYTRYPNRNFDIGAMADTVISHWEKTQPEQIVLVGPSEGTPVWMLIMLSVAAKHQAQLIRSQRHQSAAPRPLPKIATIAACSSPSCMADTSFDWIGNKISYLHTEGVGIGDHRRRYEPGLASKYVMELLRPQDGNAGFVDRLKNALHATTDINSVGTMAAMVSLLKAFNYRRDFSDFRTYLTPGFTTFDYYGTEDDAIVNNKRGFHGYDKPLSDYKVETNYIPVGKGHANIGRATRLLSKSIVARYAEQTV